tara:strand:- start:5425 stop:5718 length:294 start_codon:yes stop_codon:yes gene_type:complete
METLISSFNTINFENHVPPHILNDLEYICYCYVNEITELNFGDVASNTTVQYIQNNDQFTYRTLYNIIVNKLSKLVSIIDDSLLHSYLEYYITFLNN